MPKIISRTIRAVVVSLIFGYLIFAPVFLWASNTSDLITAAKNGDLDKVYQYLAGDADVSGKNNKGRTALIQAAISENSDAIQIIELLLDAGSDINATDNKGNTALIHAAKKGDAGLVQLLLSKDANPELKNSSGYTALEKAEDKNRYYVIKILKNRNRYSEALAMFIDIRHRNITSKIFQDAATKAFKRRKWKIIKTEQDMVIATLPRRNIAYKSRFILEKNDIILRYDYGFGGTNLNYLNNLKVDFLRYIKK